MVHALLNRGADAFWRIDGCTATTILAHGFSASGDGTRRMAPPLTIESGPGRRPIRPVYSLLFSLPGTPVPFYGEEIGMAETLALEGHMSVHAPMQSRRKAVARPHRPKAIGGPSSRVRRSGQ